MRSQLSRNYLRDSGGGIPAHELPRIFERFYRVDTGDQGGSGLGLPIARALVEAHGGTLDVASAVGGGTTFTIRLPAARAAAVETAAPA